MKTLLRSLIQLLVAAWVGGLIFFPVVAWVAFRTLPDTHTAGTVVRLCLRMLHAEGLVAGLLLVGLLLVAGIAGAYRRTVLGPVTVTLVMLALTAFSQYSIMPRMDADRYAVGGSIEQVSPEEPHRAEFDRLHRASEWVEEGVLVVGILLLVLLARGGTGVFPEEAPRAAGRIP